MICFILAAGFGTRLKPITDFIPKCLVEVNGKPILSYWLDQLMLVSEIDEVIINTHYLPEKVTEFIKSQSSKYPYKITEYYEPVLLGSAGTIWANKEKLLNNDILIIYADNFSSISLVNFISNFKKNKSQFNVAVFHAEIPEKCGIFEVDSDNKVLSFEEKPKYPKSNLANAGLYAFQGNSYLETIKGNEFDIGFDIIPQFIKNSSVYLIENYHVDIGTHELLEKANNISKNFKK